MKKYIISLVSFAALMMLLSACDRPEQQEGEYLISTPAYYDPLFQRDENCDFRGIRWGMTFEEVKAMEGLDPVKEDVNLKPNEAYLLYEKINFHNFVEVKLGYFFYMGKCFMGIYDFVNIDHQSVLHFLENVYGEPTYTYRDGTDSVIGWQVLNSHIFLRDFSEQSSQQLYTVVFVSKDYSPEDWHN